MGQQQKSKAIIMLDSMNVLYCGLANEISIKTVGIDAQRVQLVSSNGDKIVKDSSGKYIISPTWNSSNYHKSMVITTLVDKKPYDSSVYKLKFVPKPEPYFGKLKSGIVSIDEVLEQDTIYAKMPDYFPLEKHIKYNVTKYILVYTPHRKDPMFFSVVGSAISPQIKKALRDNIGEHCTIQISGIEALGPESIGQVRLESAVALTVK